MPKAIEAAMVRMPDGDWHELPVCGRAPKHEGQSVIIVQDSQLQCYAARLGPVGYIIITEPIRLYSE